MAESIFCSHYKKVDIVRLKLGIEVITIYVVKVKIHKLISNYVKLTLWQRQLGNEPSLLLIGVFRMRKHACAITKQAHKLVAESVLNHEGMHQMLSPSPSSGCLHCNRDWNTVVVRATTDYLQPPEEQEGAELSCFRK